MRRLLFVITYQFIELHQFAVGKKAGGREKTTAFHIHQLLGMMLRLIITNERGALPIGEYRRIVVAAVGPVRYFMNNL